MSFLFVDTLKHQLQSLLIRPMILLQLKMIKQKLMKKGLKLKMMLVLNMAMFTMGGHTCPMDTATHLITSTHQTPITELSAFMSEELMSYSVVLQLEAAAVLYIIAITAKIARFHAN